MSFCCHYIHVLEKYLYVRASTFKYVVKPSMERYRKNKIQLMYQNGRRNSFPSVGEGLLSQQIVKFVSV